MDQIEYGFIAHGAQGLWFRGPLPSPKCARLLAQFHGGIDIDEIPDGTRSILNQKWELQYDFPAFATQYPDRAKKVTWALSLESIIADAPEVQSGLAFIEKLRIPVFNGLGPFFPKPATENWSGEDC